MDARIREIARRLPLHLTTSLCDNVDPLLKVLTGRGLYEADGMDAYEHWTDVLDHLPSSDRVVEIVEGNAEEAHQDGEGFDIGVVLAAIAVQSRASPQLTWGARENLIACLDYFEDYATRVHDGSVPSDLGWEDLSLADMKMLIKYLRDELARGTPSR